MKVAITDRFALTVTVQLVPLTESQPLKPEKIELEFGSAVTVSLVPLGTDTTQVVPQLIPSPLTTPVPSPLFAMLSVTPP